MFSFKIENFSSENGLYRHQNQSAKGFSIDDIERFGFTQKEAVRFVQPLEARRKIHALERLSRKALLEIAVKYNIDVEGK